jgi:DNA-binding phage protein
MALKTRPFDPANYLRNADDDALFLAEMSADGDPREIAEALTIIGRAKARRASADALTASGAEAE